MAKKINTPRAVLWTAIILIFLVSVFLRFWGIWQGSFAYTYDVGRDLMAINRLVYEHHPSLLGPTSGQGGIFYGPWWYWLMGLPFFLVGGSPAGMVGTIALSGLAAMFIIYLWGKKFEGEVFALLAFGVMGLSSYYVGTTSQFWNPNLLIIVTSIDLILLAKIRSLNYKWAFLFGLFLTLAIELQLFFGTFLFITTVLCLVIFHRPFLFSKKIIFFLAGFLFIEFPRLIFELKYNFLQTKAFFTSLNSTTSSPFEYHLDVRLKAITEYLSSVWPINNGGVVWALSVAVALLFLYFIYRESRPEQKIFYSEVAILIGVYLLATIFYQKDFWNYYLTGLPVLLVIPASLVLSRLVSPFGGTGVWLILFLCIAFLRPASLWKDLTGPKLVGDASVYRNQIEVVDYLYRETQGKDFNVTIYTPPTYSYTWDYLFKWYASKKYRQMPSSKTSTRLFIVIEPDPGFEGRITIWLRVREGDGKVVKEKAFPSGIIVQSRERAF